MKKISKIFSVLAVMAIVCLPLFAHALEKQPQLKGEVIMKVGAKVQMFHSGTGDVKNDICIGDVIPVYREHPYSRSLKVEAVGKVKVLGLASEHYFEGEIVEGQVKVGDIAKKETGACACLIQPIKEKK